MGETSLRALLEDAVSSEPAAERPLGRAIGDARRSGRRLRSRRRIEGTVASFAGVAVLAVAASFVSGAFVNAHHPGPLSHSGRSPETAYVLTTLGGLHHARGAIVPVNLATMKAGRPLQSGLKGILTYSNDIVAARGGRTLYVSTSNGMILPISTATGKIGRVIRVDGSSQSDELVGAPDGKIAYAANYSTASIAPIDLVTGRALRRISVPAAFEAEGYIAVSRDGGTLLTAGSSHFTSTVVTVVTDERAQNPIRLKGPLGTTCVAVSPDGAMGYLFRSVRGHFVVVPIDVAANRPLAAIKLPSEQYGPNADQCSMVVSPNGRTAYVLVGQYVVPIDLMNARVLRPIKLRGLLPGFPQLGIDPDGRMAYALGQGGVTPIDLVTHKALPTIDFHHGVYCLAFSPDGKTVLVGIGGRAVDSGMVVPIQAATGKAGKAIPMPSIPGSMAVTP